MSMTVVTVGTPYLIWFILNRVSSRCRRCRSWWTFNWADKELSPKGEGEVWSNPNQFCLRCVRHSRKAPLGYPQMLQTWRFKFAQWYYLKYRIDKRRAGVFLTGSFTDHVLRSEEDVPEGEGYYGVLSCRKRDMSCGK